MAENPSQHPAVVTPKQVLGNAQVVKGKQALTPPIQSSNTVNNKPKRNADEQILDRIFPDMSDVHVRPMGTNKNLLVKNQGYSGWTQSTKEIFYNYELNGSADPHLKALILHHEGIHIKRFRASGRPKSFAEMLKYEVEAATKNDEWINEKTTDDEFYADLPDEADTLAFRQVSRKRYFANLEILRISEARRVGYVASMTFGFLELVATAVFESSVPDDTTYEDIVFRNMRINGLLPEIVSGKEVYNVSDMYSQEAPPRYERFGYYPK